MVDSNNSQSNENDTNHNTITEQYFNKGKAYWLGENVEQDYDQAIKFFKKAADEGHVDALYKLGEMYAKGHGVPQDCQKAFEWVQKAADEGHVDALYELGAMYEYGKDYKKALEYFKKAADQGHMIAQVKLSDLEESIHGAPGIIKKFLNYFKRV